ncbi:hypothetical protein H6P81_017736 [Aristolochia fimbriata]|uniref:Uncharacterized protein n=1 Tax=Aristolochia fimbriata TaxID=158543 RepID=A0AAV7E3A8_ARIFI|nr:hypothetical protein H6P81_017736 [Aristolochia fimbriata]
MKPVLDLCALSSDVVVVDGDEYCRTPTSDESKIPVVIACPNAPKKPHRVLVVGKRKLLSAELADLEFYFRPWPQSPPAKKLRI